MPEERVRDPVRRGQCRARGRRRARSWRSAAMVQLALEAADALAKEGIECEVIDLRTISPLDMDTVLESVESTGRLVVRRRGQPALQHRRPTSSALVCAGGFGSLKGRIRDGHRAAHAGAVLARRSRTSTCPSAAQDRRRGARGHRRQGGGRDVTRRASQTLVMPKWGLSMKEGKVVELARRRGRREIAVGERGRGRRDRKIAARVESPSPGCCAASVAEEGERYRSAPARRDRAGRGAATPRSTPSSLPGDVRRRDEGDGAPARAAQPQTVSVAAGQLRVVAAGRGRRGRCCSCTASAATPTTGCSTSPALAAGRGA